jgi:glycosyltransferase involved in cell wall biosynthesis
MKNSQIICSNKTKQDIGLNILFYASVNDISLFKKHGFYMYDRESLEYFGCNVVFTNKWTDFFKYSEYDVAYLYFFTKSIIPASIGYLLGKKIYFTGGIDSLSKFINGKWKRLFYGILFLIAYYLATRIIVVSSDDKNNMSKYLIGCSKLIYIPHGIRTLSNINECKEYLVENVDRENIFTTICWMECEENVLRKGIYQSLILFKKFIENNNEGEFIIIGEFGRGTKLVKSWIAHLSLTKYVTLTGYIPEYEKKVILLKTKYYLQISNYEGFGLGALEGLLYGAIVIHSNRGGLKDTVNKRGIILDIHNFESEVNRVVSLLPVCDDNYHLNDLQSHLEQYSIENRGLKIENVFNHDL